MKSNSNNFKRNQFNCLQSQADKQVDRMLFSLMISREHPFFHQKKKKRFQKFLFKGALLPCAFKNIQRLLKNIKEYADEEPVYNIKEAIHF